MALISPTFDPFFLRVVNGFKPYLNQVVFVGGCANSLYRFAADARKAPTVMVTFDVDVSVPTPNKIKDQEISLFEALTAQGFVPVPDSEPTNKYKIDPSANEKLELICPNAGLSKSIKDKTPSLAQIQPGIVAEALDYLDLLELNPIQIDLTHIPDLKVSENLTVQVPHPLLYVIQKALIRKDRRSRESRRKDSYYIYEIAVLFRDAMGRLAQEAGGLSFAGKAKRLKAALETLHNLFAHPAAEGVVETVDIASDSSQTISTQEVMRATRVLAEAVEQTISQRK
jgi:hypothetical protein